MSGKKVGLDDFIAAGHGLNDLLALAVDRLPDAPEDPFDSDAEYFASADGIFRRKATEQGAVTLHLTNFNATIVGDIREDDGVEVRRLFEIEATLGERRATIRVPSLQFPTLNWAPEHLGARAIVFPGSTTRDHTRVAIQVLSGEPLEQTIYSHLGWRSSDRGWMYLHAGGAITASGNLADVSVNPPESLSNYILPPPPLGERRLEAIQSSRRLLGVAPRRVTLPVFSAIYRAPLGGNDHSIHASGETGAAKTALATLAQQHYGLGLDVDHLPGSWSSTGNALEVLAFAAKDALFVIDDFVPRGGSQEVARLHREADRILRAQGNASGRQRLRPDATLRPVKRPRGFILSTGEDVPLGHSLRARMLIVEFNKEEINWGALTAAQTDAASGLYAECMSAYLAWLAARYSDVRNGLVDELTTLRSLASREGMHARTPTVIASLGLGYKYFLDFAVDARALTRAEANVEWTQAWAEFVQIGISQKRYHDESEPTLRFRQLLSAAIASGHAHVAAMDGTTPTHPESWGWRLDSPVSPMNSTWEPRGSRVGWLDGDNLFLEPDAAFATAQEMARHAGDTITIGGRTLHKRLADHSLLRSTEQGTRSTLTVRRVIQGERRPVLHVHAGVFLFAGTDQPDQEGERNEDSEENLWSSCRLGPARPDHETDHEEPIENINVPTESKPKPPNGQFGQVPEEEDAPLPSHDAHTERFEV